MIKHITIIVSGHVQGVFFRQSVRDVALVSELVGYAKNESDGTVLIEAEGEEGKLERLIAWCDQGPKKGKVENITFKYDEIIEGYHDFIIR